MRKEVFIYKLGQITRTECNRIGRCVKKEFSWRDRDRGSRICICRKILGKLRREFGEKDNKSTKVAKLIKME